MNRNMSFIFYIEWNHNIKDAIRILSIKNDNEFWMWINYVLNKCLQPLFPGSNATNTSWFWTWLYQVLWPFVWQGFDCIRFHDLLIGLLIGQKLVHWVSGPTGLLEILSVQPAANLLMVLPEGILAGQGAHSLHRVLNL